jgi:hypothetical protein
MGLLDRIFGSPRSAEEGASLAADADAMRDALDRLAADGDVTPREAVRALLGGQVDPPTADVAALRERGTAPDDFYAREVAPSWDGLSEAQRAARLDGFLEMCALLEGAPDAVPAEMGEAVRTKTLVLAWAFDERYGYLSRLAGSQ